MEMACNGLVLFNTSSTMEIVKKLHFHMGHRVPNHKSKCKNVHGHTYNLEVVMDGDVVLEHGVSEEGMVIDFSDIKTIVSTFIDQYLDHGYMGHQDRDHLLFGLLTSMDSKYLAVDFIPTAENIAIWLFMELYPRFKDTYGTKLHLKRLRLWETPTSYAECTWEDLSKEQQVMLSLGDYKPLPITINNAVLKDVSLMSDGSFEAGVEKLNP